MSLLDTGTVYPYVSEQVGYEPGAGYYLIATGAALSIEEAAALAGGAMYGSLGDGIETVYPGGRGGEVVDYPVGLDRSSGIYTMTGAAGGGVQGSGLLPFLLIAFALFAARH